MRLPAQRHGSLTKGKVNARFLHTRREGSYCQENVYRNSVQK